MATYRPLRLGAEPRVLTFPWWLMHDVSIARPVSVLRKAPGATLWHDRQTAVLILPEALLGLPEVHGALYALLDELTVWRLSSADGTCGAFRGMGVAKEAQTARWRAGVRVRGAA